MIFIKIFTEFYFIMSKFKSFINNKISYVILEIY